MLRNRKAQPQTAGLIGGLGGFALPGAGNNSFRPALSALNPDSLEDGANIQANRSVGCIATKPSATAPTLNQPLIENVDDDLDEEQVPLLLANRTLSAAERGPTPFMGVADVDMSLSLSESSSLNMEQLSGEGDSLLGHKDSVNREQQYEGGPDPAMYPADLNGFIAGLSEGLSNISRDIQTSKFAAGVSVDAASIWTSTQDVMKLLIQPVLPLGPDPSDSEYDTDEGQDGNGGGGGGGRRRNCDDAAGRARAQAKFSVEQQRAQSANAFRSSSHFGGAIAPSVAAEGAAANASSSLLPPYHGGGGGGSVETDENGGGGAQQPNSSSNRRRRSGEMGATKLAMTPRGKGSSRQTWNGGEGSGADGGGGGSSAPESSGDDERGGEGQRGKRRHRSSKEKQQGGGASAKAEVGSAIDLRKLASAKKVQVFRGPGSGIMVVGQRRLVVIEAKPTPKEPHQGVVRWMSSLEHVASIALEIQPGNGCGGGGGADLSVALNVVVRPGPKDEKPRHDHTFVMGVQDSTALVQSIYARLNGEEPPALVQKREQRHQQDHAKKLAAAAAAPPAVGDGDECVSGGESSASSSGENVPRTPSGKSSGRSARLCSSSKGGLSSRKHRHHRSSTKSSSKHPRSSRKEPRGGSSGCCLEGEGSSSSSRSGAPLSPRASAGTGCSDAASPVCKKQAGGRPEADSATSTPPSKTGGNGLGLLSPLRIVLSPTGRGKRLSLEMTSISNAEGTLSMLGGGGGGGECDGGLSEAAQRMSLLTRPDGNALGASGLEGGDVEGAAPPSSSLPPSSSEAERTQQLPAKYALMLKNGVPEQAVRNKAASELLATAAAAQGSESGDGSSSSSATAHKAPITEAELDAMFGAFLAAAAAAPKPKPAVDVSVAERAPEEKPPTADTAAAAAAVGVMTDEEDKQTRKYRGMLKAGVPVEAVKHKMVADGIEARIIDLILRPTAPTSLASQTTTSSPAKEAKKEVAASAAVLTDEEDKQTRKYRGMLKAGVPVEAVKHKMVADGLEARLVRAVAGEGDDDALDDDKVETLTVEEEAKVAKYRGMLKAGVPTQAVKHKMVGDGLEARLVASVCGGCKGKGGSDAQGGTETWRGRGGEPSTPGSSSSSSSANPNSPPKPKVPLSKLLTLHWTPLGLSEEEHANSVWATLGGDGGGVEGGGGAENGGTGTPAPGPRFMGGRVLSPEMEKLELLFSKKKPVLKAAAADGGEESAANKAKQKSKKKVVVLDTARMQNLGIGLRSFKDFPGGALAIGPAVAALSAGLFTPEQLARLDEMLPTDSEVGLVERHAKGLAKEAAASAAAAAAVEQIGDDSTATAAPAVGAGLEPAELFVLGFSGVLRVKPKVTVLTLMGTLGQEVFEACASLEVVRQSSLQATKSTKLARLLAEVLAVGNVMNQGTSKGGAKGITVESLLKLTQTKSVCKTLTVLDFITGSLLAKEEARQARVAEAKAAADILADGEENDDDGEGEEGSEAVEGEKTACALSLLSTNATLGGGGGDVTLRHDFEISDDGGLDEAAPLNFYLDCPDLEAASRLPFGELASNVSSLRQGLGTAARELAKLKTEANKEVKEAAKNAKKDVARKAKQGKQQQQQQQQNEQEEDQEEIGVMALKGDFSQLTKVAAAAAATSAESVVTLRGGAAKEEDSRSALMDMLKARAGTSKAGATTDVIRGGGGNDDDGRDLPVGRGLAEAMHDEAVAVETTRAAATSAELKVSAALASDPRQGLMAALKSRRATDESEKVVEGEAAKGAASSLASAEEEKAEEKETVPATPAAQAAAKLSIFLEGCGEELVQKVEAALLEAKAAAGDMASFFGEKGGPDSAAHVFECLRQFAAMTRESRCRAEARSAEQARSLRLKARQDEEQRQKLAHQEAAAGSGSSASGGLAGAPNLVRSRSKASVEALAAAASGSIDPKAGLMAEIRSSRELRLDCGLSATGPTTTLHLQPHQEI